MKKTLLFVLFFALNNCFIFAQDKKSINIEEEIVHEVKMGDRSMSKGSQNSYTVILASSEKKELEKSWSKFMKEYKGKTKRDKKTDEHMTDNAQISSMSDNTVDVYTRFQELGNETQMTVWFDLGGAFVTANGHPEASATAQNILVSFAKTVDKKNVEELLKLEEKNQKKVEGELKKNEKELKKLEKDIENYQKKIKEAEEKIVKNKEQKVDIDQRLKTQKEKVIMVKDKLKKM
ncbi:MAG: hypothetical protein AAF985_07200 [Bacteroidota bacterium]